MAKFGLATKPALRTFQIVEIPRKLFELVKKHRPASALAKFANVCSGGRPSREDC